MCPDALPMALSCVQGSVQLRAGLPTAKQARAVRMLVRARGESAARLSLRQAPAGPFTPVPRCNSGTQKHSWRQYAPVRGSVQNVEIAHKR